MSPPGAAAASAGPTRPERRVDPRPTPRWIGWRLRLMVLAAVLGCLGCFGWMRWLADSPHVPAAVQADPQGRPILLDSSVPALAAESGRPLVGIETADGRWLALDGLADHESPRWQVDDERRARLVQRQQALADALAGGSVTLRFDADRRVALMAPTRGVTGLGLLFWPLTALALLLWLVAAAVLLARPQWRNALFALMALGQAGNLLFIALESAPGLGLPAGALAHEFVLRVGFDLATAAAAVHAFALHPRRLARARSVGAIGWGAALLVVALVGAGALPRPWWWAQGTMLALGLVALAVVTASLRVERNPFGAVARRFAAVAVATLALLTLAAAFAAGQAGVPQVVTSLGALVWTLFLASLLLLAPFLSRSRQVLREFAMLAGISTVATSLDLLFVTLFALGRFTSLTLALFLSLGAYAGARQWILNKMVGRSVLTTERAFEQLYRVAREVQAQPSRYAPLLEQLLRDLFEPLEVLPVPRGAAGAQVIGGGSSLVVPVQSDPAPSSLVLRFARRGKRLFGAEDARLADRVLEQLRRALAYDQAVERGRNEERLRIAQDLHDDIGARLLTLMYQAPSPEMEDYIRHTLLDLKTLTRGLASSEHRLSHAAAEWKSDLTQRLKAAHVELGWAFDHDEDPLLSVVQWSALTRVLRELTSNSLYHAHATRLDIALRVSAGRLTLTVADDGVGREPQTWSHGLGLGGVRKRVKLLGGEVRWRENQPRGIVCEVEADGFTAGA
jgi:signal transduction histidine kinase